MAQTATAARRPKRDEAPAPSLWTHGTFHWNELLARDVERRGEVLAPVRRGGRAHADERQVGPEQRLAHVVGDRDAPA